MSLSPINRISTALHTQRVSRVYGIDALAKLLQTYLPEFQIDAVRRAHAYGERQHKGQFRKTGEPYIYHPLAVARILAEMHLDHTTIMAAILHDVIEDTDAARAEIAEEFGEEVAVLVEGVSKLDKAQFVTRAEAQAENFRKLVMAMTHDIRVIMVKLADRLHNMRTLGGRVRTARARTARETLDIYAPIARRLGINSLRQELEDLGFENLYPNRYDVLKRASRQVTGNRKNLVREIEETLSRALGAEGIDSTVIGRRKNLYSIYRKMRQKHRRFLDVFDLYGFRVIVEEDDECYRALGIVHHCYRPISEQFNDFIANPKANGYQSLHTTVMARGGVKFEVQIRTQEMHKIAESGIAAHWQYKLGGESARTTQANAQAWLSGLMEAHTDERSSVRFLENMRVDLMPEEVYVFSPKGAIFQLPKGASCVDFAYAVHTELGNHCVAARVDGHLASLASVLISGQMVEIITARHARPNAAWLHFLRTSKARAGVLSYLKTLRADKAKSLGHRLLDKSLRDLGLSARKLKNENIAPVLAQLEVADMDALYVSIGLGQRLAPLVARHFLPDDGTPRRKRKRSEPLAVEGTEGLVVEFARCCHPVPGDAIHGQVSVGRGMVVHRFGCTVSAQKTRLGDRVELVWSEKVSGEYPVELRVASRNERGGLARLTAKLTDADCNIESVSFPERSGVISAIRFVILVRDRQHLANVIRRLRRLPAVERVTRA